MFYIYYEYELIKYIYYFIKINLIYLIIRIFKTLPLLALFVLLLDKSVHIIYYCQLSFKC